MNHRVGVVRCCYRFHTGQVIPTDVKTSGLFHWPYSFLLASLRVTWQNGTLTPTMAASTLNRRIAQSAGIVMASVLASRLLGFLREWSVAHQIGSPLWSSTAVFLTHDDSDGWYDYVMPTIINSSAT